MVIHPQLLFLRPQIMLMLTWVILRWIMEAVLRQQEAVGEELPQLEEAVVGEGLSQLEEAEVGEELLLLEEDLGGRTLMESTIH
jgi:hypothetical protein